MDDGFRNGCENPIKLDVSPLPFLIVA